MNSAGRNQEFEKVLAAAQKQLDKKLKFVKTDMDLLQYIDKLTFEMKTEKGEVLFRDNKNELQYYPCVTKFISFTDSSVKFPQDKKRNPFECAKVQFLLCKKANLSANTEQLQQKAAAFQCNCKTCYRLAMEGVFKGGGLCL